MTRARKRNRSDDLDLPHKAESSGSVSAGMIGGNITRVSHKEPLGGCGDGKLGNLGQS